MQPMVVARDVDVLEAHTGMHQLSHEMCVGDFSRSPQLNDSIIGPFNTEAVVDVVDGPHLHLEKVARAARDMTNEDGQ